MASFGVPPIPGPGFRVPKPLADAFAGAVAGSIARIVVNPLDVIKIRFQVQLEPVSKWGSPVSKLSHLSKSKYTGLFQATKDIVKEEGALGLWRGTVPGLLLVIPYCSIQFVVVQWFKTLMSGSSKEDAHHRLSPAYSYLGGSVAGVAATIGSYPFDLLRTVMASQGEPKVYPTLAAATSGIYAAKGFRGFFAGLPPTLIEIVPYAGLQFGLYDSFKRWMRLVNQRVLLATGHRSFQTQPTTEASNTKARRGEEGALTQLQQFVCGLAAGTMAKVACHPLDVVKKRFQVEGLARHSRYGAPVQAKAYANLWDALHKIVANEGWMGLYKGLLPSVIKAAPAAAITFFMFEVMSKQLEPYVIRGDDDKESSAHPTH